MKGLEGIAQFAVNDVSLKGAENKDQQRLLRIDAIAGETVNGNAAIVMQFDQNTSSVSEIIRANLFEFVQQIYHAVITAMATIWSSIESKITAALSFIGNLVAIFITR